MRNSKTGKLTTKTTKKIETFLKGKLGTDPRWVAKAILVVYQNQTNSEKNAQATIMHNNIGFTGADAGILSSFAVQLTRGKTLTDKQLYRAYTAVPKYWRQIMDASEISRLIEMASA